MNLTRLLYLDDFTGLTAEAQALEMLEESGRTTVVLDQTIFYPQGGGQPYDTGTIESSSGRFAVEEVRFADGIVKHIGKLEQGAFVKGEVVRCSVDKDRRELHSRIHSAGHLVDLAVTQLNLNWIPGKGYHFPDGPYVEYAGSIEGVDKEKLKKDIETECNGIIQKGQEVKVRFMEQDEMRSVCHFVPENIPTDKPGRVVLFGDFGVPCGGTHVQNLAEIKHMTIRKIKPGSRNSTISTPRRSAAVEFSLPGKAKGDTIQVGYDVVSS